jgi:SAM-dependent methyltransferase
MTDASDLPSDLRAAALVSQQLASFREEPWSETDLLPYRDRRDNTFGQYASNYHLLSLEPFVRTLSGKTAVTVCDGRGVEASYLTELGMRVTATDLCASYLQEKHERGDGVFSAFSEQNAERLSFASESFDWAMVKAGLHHLPRPLIGLYELLRVAREGVIVIEAHDGKLVRMFRALSPSTLDWEPSGNFVYRFTERELEKVCLGLDLPCFAINIAMIRWSSVQEQVKRGSLGYVLRKRLNAVLNTLIGRQGNAFCFLIFKRSPSSQQVATLRRNGFRCKFLPRNPYAHK